MTDTKQLAGLLREAVMVALSDEKGQPVPEGVRPFSEWLADAKDAVAAADELEAREPVAAPWDGTLSRIDAIAIMERATDKDDPHWEWAVEDWYCEDSDTFPTLMDALAALGVTEAEHKDATGAQNCNWPTTPPAPQVPDGYIKVTEKLLSFLCSVGHHGAVITDEGQPYEIDNDDIAYAQDLFTELRDAAAPQPDGGKPLKDLIADFEKNPTFEAAIKDGRIWIKSAAQPDGGG